MLTWRTAALSDAGCQRQKNEDNFFVSPDNKVFVVADGMGGAAGGAMASGLAVQEIENNWTSKLPAQDDILTVKEWLQNAILKANQSICKTAQKDPSLNGMGTTIVVAMQTSNGNSLQIAHVGDSRAYLIREGKAQPITCDHSVVHEMVRAGKLTEEQARVNPYKNLITRCLGHDLKVEVDQTSLTLQPNDYVVLCSDGLPNELNDDQIAAVFNEYKDAPLACEQLINLTLKEGARDNVTVIVIQILAD